MKFLGKHLRGMRIAIQLVINTPEAVKDDVRQFIERMPEERINMKNIGLDMELDEVLQLMEKVFNA